MIRFLLLTTLCLLTLSCNALKPEKVDTRARARAVSLKVANTAAAQSWKLGGFRLDIQPDGRR